MVKKARGTKRRHKGTHKAAKKRTAKKHKLHIKRSIHSHRRKYRKLHVGGTGVISQASIDQASADKKKEDDKKILDSEISRRLHRISRRQVRRQAHAAAAGRLNDFSRWGEAHAVERPSVVSPFSP